MKLIAAPILLLVTILVFTCSLWLFGGAESSGKKDVTPVRSFHDVWQSSDGVEWKQISSNMPASDEQVLVFQNQNGRMTSGS